MAGLEVPARVLLQTLPNMQQMPNYSFLFSQLVFVHPMPIDLACQPRQFGLLLRDLYEIFMSFGWEF